MENNNNLFNSDFDNPYLNKPNKPKKSANFIKYFSIIIITSIVNTFVVGGFFYYKILDKNEPKSLISKSTSGNNSNQTSASFKEKIIKTSSENGLSVVDIAKAVSPSIVGIRMSTTTSSRSFWGLNFEPSTSEGSGIIISPDGYIATNYHVVSSADPKNNTSKNTTLEVFLSDNRSAKASFVGGDSLNDLAVIKINLDKLPSATLGDSSKTEVGELAVAIGNPLGMEFAGSVTVGVTSAVNRSVEIEEGKSLTLIQTDAAINPGNSGGALLNSYGEVIGINTIKIKSAEGLGFAIPINTAKPIIESLKSFGYVKGRPLIGLSGQDITPILSKQYDLPEGIYITSVTLGSGPYTAGIRRGDILTKIDNENINSLKELDKFKLSHKAGDTVVATIFRDKEEIKLKITFTEER